jgi:hypothetical protein
MKSKRFFKLQVFGLIVLGLIVIHYLFFRAPSEVQMLNKFHQRKAEFEQIRLMLEHDRNVQTIGWDWVTPKLGPSKAGPVKSGPRKGAVEMHELPLNLSKSRIALYRSRLKKLGFDRVDSKNGCVFMAEFAGGFGGHTWAIGYIWSAKPLKPLVKSAYAVMPMKDHWHYSHIEGNWYMFHRR